MNIQKKIARNVFSNWATSVVVVAVTFFLSPFVVHILGDTSYGIWVLVGSLTGYFGLLDLGIRPAIVKFSAQYDALELPQKINEVINTSLFISSLIAVVVLAGSVVLAYMAPVLFKVAPELQQPLRVVIILTGIKIALDFPFAVFAALFSGFQRFDLSNLITLSVFLVRSVCIVIFLKLGGGLIALGVIILAAGLMEGVLKMLLSSRVFPELRISPRMANKETLKTIYGFSVYVFVIGIASQLSFYTDSIVIGYFISAGAITLFAIGGNLIQYLKGFISQITVTFTPVASGFGAHHDFDRLRKLLFVGTKYCLLIILPVGLVFLVMGETFITLWMGETYGPPSSKVLGILMWSYFGFLAQLVSGSILLGLGKIRVLAIVNLAMAVANLIISILLVGPMGIYGVALGTAIPQMIYGTFFLPIYVCRRVGVRLRDYIKASAIPPLLASIPFLALILLFENLIPIRSLALFAVIIVGCCGVYAIFGYALALEPEHRGVAERKWREIVHRILRKNDCTSGGGNTPNER